MNVINNFFKFPSWNPNNTNFIKNMKLPIHRWFRFPAGFSAIWVERIIDWYATQNNLDLGSFTVLDPFAGSGTTVLAAENIGVKAWGIEAQPCLAKIARTKLLWDTNLQSLKKFSKIVFNEARAEKFALKEYPNLIHRIYSNEALSDLNSLRCSWENNKDESPESELTWLCITAILRPTSHARTAPWQYVLPSKSKKIVVPPYECYKKQMDVILEDICSFRLTANKTGKIIHGDSRNDLSIGDNEISLITTSPPYANNYDYADATRLEMSFWGNIRGWGDLGKLIRKDMIRSCSQHVSSTESEMREYLGILRNTSIYDEISAVAERLSQARKKHGGHKQYHVMIPAYFSDLYLVWQNLRRMCKNDCLIAFVIGDSAPYGVHVPVEQWLGELAVKSGFKDYIFEKIKDRNIKWTLENRKHLVPLKEGILWVM